jgi:hypothetical protein
MASTQRLAARTRPWDDCEEDLRAGGADSCVRLTVVSATHSQLHSAMTARLRLGAKIRLSEAMAERVCASHS